MGDSVRPACRARQKEVRTADGLAFPECFSGTPLAGGLHLWHCGRLRSNSALPSKLELPVQTFQRLAWVFDTTNVVDSLNYAAWKATAGMMVARQEQNHEITTRPEPDIDPQ